MTEEHPKPFRLENKPPRREYKPKPTPHMERQRVFFAGMDCEPGQLDLFETDGDEATG